MIMRLAESARYCLVAALAAMAVVPARAADDPPSSRPASSPPRFVSETRLGIVAHDPDSPESGGADLNAEILFAQPFAADDPAWNAFIPRPHLGTTLSFNGKTSFAYAGLTWTVDVWRGLFAEASFGGAVNNGETGSNVPIDRSPLGCNVSFRESGSLGYRFTENWSLMATIEHYSNAGLCDDNRGMTNFGVRLGYRF